ncbi:DUF2935 domain-containing protein [Bacillus alkalicellulosilyticus]|uniref:DUF2935 domain-containing protein n=1 Tax=Alkalihalobacterium alkalicellulosilyticum TaxID=1912214 RepID=UPI0009970B97|nr:DUF2935 domain-containing protein [Bacillus alkalicellulosilyticus]
MLNSNLEISVWEEHQFWLEILEDHAHFIHDFLAPSETKWIDMAKQYITSFQQLQQQLQTIPSTSPLDSNEMIQIAHLIEPYALGYYKFEGHIQQLRVFNEVNLNLPPTYLNGTLNENEEYLRLLSYYKEGKNPPLLRLDALMDLWLEDQVGHAALLVRALDGVELALVQKTELYKQQFQAHMLKNKSIKSYLRFIPSGSPIEQRFAKEVAQSVHDLNEFVLSIVTLFKSDSVLNQTNLRFLEHHFPESCYFLRKLILYVPDIQISPCALQKPSFR